MIVYRPILGIQGIVDLNSSFGVGNKGVDIECASSTIYPRPAWLFSHDLLFLVALQISV